MADRFPFTYGTAREILDPEAEIEWLAEARRVPADSAVIPRVDLAVLVALAHAGVAADAGSPIDPAAELPPGMTMDDAVRVFERYINH
jgi:hypothetical protein